MRSTTRSKEPGRNDPCWCGSGQKYKRCHLGRKDERPLPIGQVLSTFRRTFSRNRLCLHPDAPEGCGKVIRAHTLQRAGILSDLSGQDGHVYSFHPFSIGRDGIPKINKVGWRDASTFMGFCEKHDSPLFRPIESRPFTGSDEQTLLIGYRPICHELYQKQAALDAALALRQDLDRGRPPAIQHSIQELGAAYRDALMLGLQDNSYMKAVFDRVLKAGAFEELRSITIRLRGRPTIASTGAPHVEFTLRGKRLQEVGAGKVPLHAYAYGVVSVPDGCVFSAVWPAEFAKCGEFMESLLSYESESIPSVLTELYFRYVENTYFSLDWWSSLPPENQERITKLVPLDYGEGLIFSGMRHTEMEVAEIVHKL